MLRKRNRGFGAFIWIFALLAVFSGRYVFLLPFAVIYFVPLLIFIAIVSLFAKLIRTATLSFRDAYAQNARDASQAYSDSDTGYGENRHERSTRRHRTVYTETPEYTVEADEKSFGEEKAETGGDIAEMKKSAAYFKQLAQTTDNADLSRDINTIGAFADKLIEASESDESKLRGVRKFLNYYLPVLYKLIMKYTEIDGMRLTSADSAEIRTKITEAVHKTAEAFEVKLNTLYEGEILDIDSEISVLETMLAKDGLTVNKDFEQVLNKKDGIKEELPGTDGERKSMTLILDEVNASVDKIDELIAKVK